MMRCLALVLVAGAAMLPAPEPASAARRAEPAHTSITVTPRAPRRWRGYGFLPGYRPSAYEALGVPSYEPRPRKREWRYYDWSGNPRYGYGRPGFYRGQYNGGSFGPCYAQTPIGPMPTCQ